MACSLIVPAIRFSDGAVEMWVLTVGSGYPAAVMTLRLERPYNKAQSRGIAPLVGSSRRLSIPRRAHAITCCVAHEDIINMKKHENIGHRIIQSTC